MTMATEDSDNPDLRDRGYVYWRLLSSDPEAARAVVLSEKPEIGDDTFTLEPVLLEELMAQIATLASIYHKPPEAFVMKTMHVASTGDDEDAEEEALGEEAEEETTGGGGGVSTSAPTAAAASASRSPAPKPAAAGGDLLDLLDSSPPVSSGGGFAAFGATPAAATPVRVVKTKLLEGEAGKGINLAGAMYKQPGGQIVLDLDVGNDTSVPVSGLAIQLNKNSFGILPVNASISLPSAISNGQKTSTIVPLRVSPEAVSATEASLVVMAAIQNKATTPPSVSYFR